jgi:hypothetical protein
MRRYISVTRNILYRKKRCHWLPDRYQNQMIKLNTSIELNTFCWPPVVQPHKKFLTYYGARSFIPALTTALHYSLSWARSIRFNPSYFSNIHSNIIHALTSLIQLLVSLLMRFLSITHIYPSSVDSLYLFRQSHFPYLCHCNFSWWRVGVMSLLIMQISPVSSYLISPWSKYSLQQSVLIQLNSLLIPQRLRPSFVPIQNNMQNYSLQNILIRLLGINVNKILLSICVQGFY